MGKNIEIHIDSDKKGYEPAELEIEINNESGAENKTKKITFLELLKHPRFLIAACSGGIEILIYEFMAPVLAVRLLDFDLN